jgi:nicotinamidase-related amidase
MLTTSVLLLDFQNEMVHSSGKIGAQGLADQVAKRRVLEHAATVLDAARTSDVYVVHVRLGFRSDYSDALSVAPRVAKLKEAGGAILGTWGTEFADLVKPRAGELVITKQCVNPLFNTILLTWLLRKGISRLVLCGVTTEMVVESTARAGDDAGFAIVVLEDCCASGNPKMHEVAVESMLPAFGSVTTSKHFIESLKSMGENPMRT